MLQSNLTQENTRRYSGPSRASLPPGCEPSARQCPPPFPTLLHAGGLAFSVREQIEQKLSFLAPVDTYIHSLVVVGSAAYGVQKPGSDIDLVIITTAGGYEKVCEVLFEKEIEESLAKGGKSEFECTVLSAGDTENLFTISSPFAYSIRYGAVIRDDGYLLLLRSRRYPLRPTQEYYRTCLFEKILTPYYTALKEFRNQTQRDSPAGWLNNPIGRGFSPAQLFAQLILRMLYITLPARGMMPLTKSDIVAYAQRIYGTDAEKIASLVLSLVRSNQPFIYLEECARLKKFAVLLFKEILRIVDIDHDIRAMIADASRIARKTYDSIQHRAMRNCVV
jgi:predicted nucleotidyltransferase